MNGSALAEELRGAFPNGADQLLDWEDPDGPGPLMTALGELLDVCGLALCSTLRQELNPLTADRGLAEWERVLGIDRTEAALSGTPAERKSQLIGRLREVGPPTLDLIRRVLETNWAYGDPSTILVSEVDRGALRTAHTRTWSGSLSFGGGSGAQSVTWLVLDDPRVSDAGAQVDLTFSAPVPLVDLSITLQGPSGYFEFQVSPGRGSASAIRIYFPGFRGKAIFWVWTLTLYAPAVATLTRADLFVEGFGRDSKGGDGLGSAKFHWAPVLEITKLNLGAGTSGVVETWQKWKAGVDAARRLNYATRRADVVLWPFGFLGITPAVIGAVPDDGNAIPDACIPG